jgi:hypothetical protein
MDMKKLRRNHVKRVSPASPQLETATYPNVAPDPSMYWPSVLIIPFGPAPYLKMLTVPERHVRHVLTPLKSELICRKRRTEYEADDHADRYGTSRVS